MAIKWDENWDIGHKEIDEQHRQWIGFFNRLEEALLSVGLDDLAQVRREVIEDLVNYTEYHFKSEENFMRQTAYPDASRHWRFHKDFKNILLEKTRDNGVSLSLLNSEILAMIRNWLLEHIQVEDRKLAAHLARHGENAGA